jgi:phenylacetate-CoA ligase
MEEFYDLLETRAPQAREHENFAKLPDVIARAMTAPGWSAQLAGVDPGSVTSRAALATLPVLRKSDLKDRQQEQPPLGGFAVAAPGALKRLLMSPGPIFEPEGQGKDWWNAFAPAKSCTTHFPIT